VTYSCVGEKYDTQIEASIAATRESLRLTEAHYSPIRLETWHCIDGHFHVSPLP
jgi:hypothetical protein